MNDLLKSELFKKLSDSSLEVSNDEMKNAYEAFAERVKILNQSENNYAVIIWTLNLTRIELLALQTGILYEQGEKCTSKSILTKNSHVSRSRIGTHLC